MIKSDNIASAQISKLIPDHLSVNAEYDTENNKTTVTVLKGKKYIGDYVANDDIMDFAAWLNWIHKLGDG